MLVVRAVCTGCKTEHQCYWGAGWGPQPGWVTGSGLQLCPKLDRVGPEGPSGVKQADAQHKMPVLLPRALSSSRQWGVGPGTRQQLGSSGCSVGAQKQPSPAVAQLCRQL